jgi:hypothetical protein
MLNRQSERVDGGDAATREEWADASPPPIREECPAARLVPIDCDLASLQSVRFLAPPPQHRCALASTTDLLALPLAPRRP